jgi:branched-chain amino acid transport system permease protein
MPPVGHPTVADRGRRATHDKDAGNEERVAIFELALFGGLIIGVVYALAGASMVVIFRTSGYISFAQGDIAAVALYIGLFTHNLGAPYAVVALVTIVSGAIFGGLVGSFVVVPIERFGAISAVLATIAVGVIIQGALTLTVGATPLAFPSPGKGVAFTLGDIDVQWADVIVLITGAMVFIALGLIFSRTSFGIAMRAINDSPNAAQILGIKAARLRRISWVIGGALSGAAGLFVAPTFALTPFSINTLLIFAFCAVVLGGFESIIGALVAGVIVGVASNLVAAFIDPNLVNFSVFLLLLIVLLVRPNGIFGRRPIQRV